MSLTEEVITRVLTMPMQRYLYNKYFPNAKRSFDEMYHNTSIVFINHHVSSTSPRPYLPNIFEIGGIHVKPVKPLPEDLKKFLDSAEEGVILFSMGSYIDGTGQVV
jgi:glucuronosyltransferase